MSLIVGGLELGPTFQVIKELDELERLGFSRADEVIDADGGPIPAGVRDDAQEMLKQQNLMLSPGARYVLELLAGVVEPVPYLDD